MIDQIGPHALFYALLLVLPVSALIARRVPFLRMVMMLGTWAALIGLLVFVVSQRGRFDPYLSRIAAVLKLDGQQVVGREVRIRMSDDGHFWANVRLGGIERRMLIDSGATITALSVASANAAGLDVKRPVFPLQVQTANGQISADTAIISDLRLGNIMARDVPVVVSPAFGDTDVLGMNFLSRLKSWPGGRAQPHPHPQ